MACYTLKRSSEVYHVWAQQSQDRGKCGNCSFLGPACYSYAAEIGRFHGSLVLLSSNDWSVTTAKHKGYARGAVRQKSITVGNTDPQNRDDHRANVSELFENARKLSEKQKRAKKYNYLGQISGTLDDVLTYCEHFKCKGVLTKFERELLSLSGDERLTAIGVHAEKERARVAKAEAARNRKEAKRNAALLADWLSGKSDVTPHLPVAYARIKGDELETTLHATVPLSHVRKIAKRVLSVVLAGKTWQANGESIRLGHYSMDSIDADGSVHIGCHDFERSEVERIASLLEL